MQNECQCHGTLSRANAKKYKTEKSLKEETDKTGSILEAGLHLGLDFGL